MNKDSGIRLPFTAFDLFSQIIPASFFIGWTVVVTPSGILAGFASAMFSRINNLIPVSAEAIIKRTELLDKIEPINVAQLNDKTQVIDKTIALIDMSLLLVVALLVVGHVILAIASLLIDKLLVGQGIEYPYVHLFGYRVERSDWRIISSKFYTGLWLLAMFVLALLLIFPNPSIFWYFVLYAGIVSVVKILAGEWKFRVYGEGECPDSPAECLNKCKKPQCHVSGGTCYGLKRFTKRMNIAIGVMTLGFSQYARALFSLFIHMFKIRKFNEEVIKLFSTTYERLFGIKVERNVDSDLFWLPYVHVHQKSEALTSGLHTYRTYYYFSRSLSVTFFLCFAYCVFIQNYNYKSPVDGELIIFGMISMVLSCVFFVHYYNIYCNHYTKQVFRAFLVLENPPAKTEVRTSGNLFY